LLSRSLSQSNQPAVLQPRQYCDSWTAAARAVLEREFNFDIPRSWKIPEKEMFCTLPAEIRAAVSRREKQRETEVRRLQNSVAELKRFQTAPEISKPVTNDKENTDG
jgi:hypothetical protein